MGPEIFRQLRLVARRLRGALPLAAALAWLGAVPAQAQVLDSETANTAAVVITSGAIVNVAEMNFGQIIPAGGGSITLSAAPTATCTSTGPIRSGLCQAARFTIMGKRTWTVRLKNQSGSTVILTNPGGATMTLNSISITPVGMTSTSGGGGWNLGTYEITNLSGIADFYLGGRLSVNATQAPGVYTGTIDVQIQFN